MAMVVTFTDFGAKGPYTAQMEAAIYQVAPAVKVVHQLANAPRFNPFLSGFLLAACTHYYSKGTVFLSVVDPGVGTAQREPLVIEAGGCFFVGPGNGLFDVVINQQAKGGRCYKINWKPKNLSSSFHGRDLFAQLAAQLAEKGELPEGWLSPFQYQPTHNRSDVNQIVYIDDYGNAMTGRRANTIDVGSKVSVSGLQIRRAITFGSNEIEQGFWYENSMGLVEIAVNQGSAADRYRLSIGAEISFS